MEMVQRGETRKKVTLALAGLGGVLTAVQMAFLALKGTPACVSNGCRIVEESVSLGPLWFNAAGLAFFLVVMAAAWAGRRRERSPLLLTTLLLAAVAVEGVLVGYQTFILHTFCPYCLTVFGILVLLNLAQGARHLFTASACFAAPFLFMAVLTTDVSSRHVNLDMGTYAVKECDHPNKELYLIFSQDCPHCRRVLKALEGCTRCQFHFNPIKRIVRPVLPHLVPRPSYDPRINVATLRILGIDSIPVLIDKSPQGLLFIKGDKAIIDYIQGSCFAQVPGPPVDLQGLMGGGSEEGVCSMEAESKCADTNGQEDGHGDGGHHP